MTTTGKKSLYGARIYLRGNRIQVTRMIRRNLGVVAPYVIDHPRNDRFVSFDDDAAVAQAVREALAGPS